eukprot:TRINITY_DN51336_c0_g1_i1.p1 TRINITY_DN51336_c0_g1~~TRINITY_DN51336_c0_g1_i1.p1  ORF type:complete len:331 (+),score=76.86 TRINITY_DN51336_c0_g1_i1:100-1092(+)
MAVSDGLLTVAGIIVLAIALVLNGLHSVGEGHVGLYWRGGALLDRITEPGLHWKVPIIDNYAEIQVTVQTDSVSNIPCGTSGGVVIMFERVEVVNKLQKAFARDTVANYTIAYDKLWIFDKVHHEINQFCSKHTLHEVAISLFDQIDEQLVQALRADCELHAPGIEILAVRVTKPQVPTAIRQEFDKREAAIASLKVAEEQRLVIEATAATEARKKTIEAQRDADVAIIHSEREVAQQRAQKEMEAIKDEMHLAKHKALADAEAYKLRQQADANRLLLTPEYLELKRYEFIAANTKIYFGSSIPTAFADNLNAGSLVSAFSPAPEPGRPQ